MYNVLFSSFLTEHYTHGRGMQGFQPILSDYTGPQDFVGLYKTLLINTSLALLLNMYLFASVLTKS